MIELTDKQIPYLSFYATDLNASVGETERNAGIGREAEMQRVVEILHHYKKNTPMLVGEAGVGKTDLVEGLASKINDGNVPEWLMNTHIYSLKLGYLDANKDGELGFFNDNLAHILEECSQYRSQVVLFIDEFHTIMGASRQGESGMDGSQLLKLPLARGTIRLIGATTFDEFHDFVSEDRALQRRLDEVTLEEPDVDTTVEILTQSIPSYQKHYGPIIIDSDLVKTIVILSIRYLTDKFLPDKAFDILDDTFDQAAMAGRQSVKLEDVQNAIYHKTGIPLDAIASALQPSVFNLRDELSQKVKGQDEAVDAVVKAVDTKFVGLNNPDKPLSFLFLGTTGVGKTELAKALAQALYKDENNMIRMDMAEFNTPDATERLLGVGRKRGILTEAVRRKPYSILLLDEIEKSSPTVWDLLLSIIDDGVIKDGRGRTVNFSNLIIILTSNLAADAIKSRNAWGGSNKNISAEESQYRETLFKKRVDQNLKQTFRPEFVNRLSNRIIFNVLKKPQIIEIAQKYLFSLIKRLNDQGYDLMFDFDTVDYLTDLGTDEDNGARPLQRVLDQEITGRLAEYILATRGDTTKGIGAYKTFIVSVEGERPHKVDLFGTRKFIFTASTEALSQTEIAARDAIFDTDNIQKMVNLHVEKPDISKQVDEKISAGQA